MKLGTLPVSTAGGLNNQPHSGHCLVVAKLIKGSQSSAGALRDRMTMMTMMEDGGGGGLDIGLLYWVTVTHFIPAAFFMLLAIWSVSFLYYFSNNNVCMYPSNLPVSFCSVSGTQNSWDDLIIYKNIP